MSRKEYELTTEQYDKLIEACRPAPMIMLQCGMPPSPQENANAAWCSLGKELGFDGMTVEPSSKGKRFFTAVPTSQRVAT
jgi:predicted TIM-barrel fold metal-dependent hydrolase